MMMTNTNMGEEPCLSASIPDPAEFKRKLWKGSGPEASPEAAWQRLQAAVEKEVREIKELDGKGQTVIPEINFVDILNGTVPQHIAEQVRHRGTAVVRGVVDEATVAQWAQMAEDYVTKENDYHSTSAEKSAVADSKNFFAEATPQIYGVYWNKAQIQARQHKNMARVRAYLNSFWNHQMPETGEWRFDPSKEASYADRQRIRHPGNVSGLVPHVDGGSIERWTDEGYREYYKMVFQGRWGEFDPWAGHTRVLAQELPSPNVSTVFRTYQGWLALSKQGKGDGTLQVVPLLRESTCQLLMRPFLSDVPAEDPFCGAFEGRQHKIVSRWHDALLQGLVSIPVVNPGDTVWWHPDIIHAVEKEHKGTGKSSVFYIGAAPLCAKNVNYLVKQRESFLVGEAGPDFPQEGKEINFVNRARIEDLSELGKQQMGFMGWEITGREPEAQLELLRSTSATLYSRAAPS